MGRLKARIERLEARDAGGDRQLATSERIARGMQRLNDLANDPAYAVEEAAIAARQEAERARRAALPLAEQLALLLSEQPDLSKLTGGTAAERIWARAKEMDWSYRMQELKKRIAAESGVPE